jgi:hypothetical protein
VIGGCLEVASGLSRVDPATTRESKQPADVNASNHNGGGDMAFYLLTIVGPDRAHADSHWASEVRLTMFGTRASSPELLLSRVCDLAKGPECAPTFRLELPDLGEIRGLRVRHGGAGVQPGCYLERIEVCATDTPRCWGVDCRQQFGRHRIDAVTERTFSLEASSASTA